MTESKSDRAEGVLPRPQLALFCNRQARKTFEAHWLNGRTSKVQDSSCSRRNTFQFPLERFKVENLKFQDSNFESIQSEIFSPPVPWTFEARHVVLGITHFYSTMTEQDCECYIRDSNRFSSPSSFPSRLSIPTLQISSTKLLISPVLP